eukprot:SAG22_NODE_1944_length_3283_cov_13.320666_2_plen_182_part_00
MDGDAAAASAVPLLDTHVHFYDPSRPGGVPWPPADSPLHRTVMPPDIMAVASAAAPAAPAIGFIAVECSNLVDDNKALLEVAAANPSVRGVVGGGIEIGDVAFAQNVDRFAAHPLFVGIRVRADPFLSELRGGGAQSEKHRADLAHLSASGLSLDVIGPATFTGSDVIGYRGLFATEVRRS